MHSNLFFRDLLSSLRGARRHLQGVKSHPIQAVMSSRSYKYSYLGSGYGGWSLVDDKSMQGSIVVSAGAGEDVSFDIELASRYRTKVVIVDPTPRAVRHFKLVESCFGQKRSSEYIRGGCQPVSAYDLSGVNSSDFQFVEKALWNLDTSIDFYEPANPRHVSHSIINYQNDYRTDTKSIKVQAVTIQSLLDDLCVDPNSVSLVKLDIEGAEIEVIDDMLKAKIFPKQVLVEFDELNNLSERGFKRIDAIHSNLTSCGYQLLMTNGLADFLYYRES